MARETSKWQLLGPPEAPDEAIHIRLLCAGCGNAFGEYLLAGSPGVLIPVGHETNELPPEPGWRRVSSRGAGVRGPLTGATAYRLERFGGRTYLRWRCGGKQGGRCSASPKIELRRLLISARRLSAKTHERPIEIRL